MIGAWPHCLGGEQVIEQNMGVPHVFLGGSAAGVQKIKGLVGTWPCTGAV